MQLGTAYAKLNQQARRERVDDGTNHRAFK